MTDSNELTFDQIEAAFPDGARIAADGSIQVSAQWLHDFARSVLLAASRVNLSNDEIYRLFENSADPSDPMTVTADQLRRFLAAAPRAAQEPVARVTGYFGGRCVIQPIDPTRLFAENTALYASPSAEPLKRRPYNQDELASHWNTLLDALDCETTNEGLARIAELQAAPRAALPEDAKS